MKMHDVPEVVVTGAVRDEAEFKNTFEFLLEQRSQGRLGRIVFSSWKTLAETDGPVLEWCKAKGIEVVLSLEPPKTMMGNCWKQHRALLAGLKMLDPNKPVLKTRTDKAQDQTRLVLQEYHSLGLSACTSPVLDFRVLCTKVSTSMMFNIADMVFIGLGHDLLKLINFEGYYDVVAVPSTINAEIRMFSWPFVQHYGFVEEYYRNMNVRRVSTKLISAEGRGYIPAYLLGLHARYFQLLRTCFQLPSGPVHRQTVPFSTVWANPPEGLGYPSKLIDGFHMAITNDAILDKIATLDFAEDAQLLQVRDALEKITNAPCDGEVLALFSWDELVDFDRRETSAGPMLRRDPIFF
ncbi:hypothetical protein KMP13_11560 [Epibacterium ulvae]|uniref:hypothetical protein n=1 Tax=Epibacterium ulvae TaxID=1156985 RepID=UPI001BFC9748|nr:hypothetical protein [Epibacterium ulvae]MBT8154523.1 hypothetical protein [Epibacterium ulvae]